MDLFFLYQKGEQMFCDLNQERLINGNTYWHFEPKSLSVWCEIKAEFTSTSDFFVNIHRLNFLPSLSLDPLSLI